LTATAFAIIGFIILSVKIIASVISRMLQRSTVATPVRFDEGKGFGLSVIIIALLCVGLFLFSAFQPRSGPIGTLAYSDFINDVNRGSVADVEVRGRTIMGHFTDGRAFQTYMLQDSSLWEILKGKDVRVVAEPDDLPERTITWFEAQPAWLQATFVAVALAFVWLLALVLVWAVAPRRLVAMYESLPGPKVIDQITEAADKRSGGLAKLLRAIGEAALLLLGTSRRARAAWIAHTHRRSVRNSLG
jgi:hypothetical protein